MCFLKQTDDVCQCLLRFCSTGDSDSESDSDASSDGKKHAKAQPKRTGNKHDKKPVKLDPNGIPYGNMREVLAADIKRYAKDLDPTTSWEGQPGGERRRFFRRLYSGMIYSLCPPVFVLHYVGPKIRIAVSLLSLSVCLEPRLVHERESWRSLREMGCSDHYQDPHQHTLATERAHRRLQIQAPGGDGGTMEYACPESVVSCIAQNVRTYARHIVGEGV